MIEMIDLHTMAAAQPFLTEFKGLASVDARAKKNIFKNNTLYIRVNIQGEGEAKAQYRYWAIQSPAELALVQRLVLGINPQAPALVADIEEQKINGVEPPGPGQAGYQALVDEPPQGAPQQPGEGEAKRGREAQRITLVYLKDCPQHTFNPTARAHRGYQVDLVGLWEDLQDKEKAIVRAIQKEGGVAPATATLDKVILELTKVETGQKSKFQKTTREQRVNQLLLSIHFLDSFCWQMAGNTGDAKSMGYFVKTGAADGAFVFVIQLIQDLVQDYPQYKLGMLSPGDYLRRAFGEAGLFGLATILSNAAWQPIVNQMMPAGDDQQPDQSVYATTALGCGLIFLTSLLVTQGLYRLSGVCQREKTLSQRWSLFKRKDFPGFIDLAFTVAVSAGTFCFTIFDKVLGIPNIFQIDSSPSSTGAMFLNGVKAGGTSYLAYWMAEFVKAMGRASKKCCKPSPQLDLDKIVAELSASMHAELDELVIDMQPVYNDDRVAGSFNQREDSRLLPLGGSRIVPVAGDGSFSLN